MEWFQAVVLGLIQGLTEFLPVSSSGHLTIFKAIFGIEADNLSFEVAVHAATVLSTIVAFRKEIWDIICGVFKFRYNSQTQYFLKICVSMIPVAVVGFFFKDQVEAVFGSGLFVVGSMLLSGFWKSGISFEVLHVQLPIESIIRDVLFLTFAGLSLAFTPKVARESNQFSWDPILEVAKLFFGIFCCIVPVLEMLRAGHEGAFAPLVARVSGSEITGNTCEVILSDIEHL